MTRTGIVDTFYSNLEERPFSRFTRNAMEIAANESWHERAMVWGASHVDDRGNLNSSGESVMSAVRKCAECGSGFIEGWYCCEEYYWSQVCLDKKFDSTPESWEDHYTEDGDCYWSDWQDTVALVA